MDVTNFIQEGVHALEDTDKETVTILIDKLKICIATWDKLLQHHETINFQYTPPKLADN